jgi:hypothetical protein
MDHTKSKLPSSSFGGKIHSHLGLNRTAATHARRLTDFLLSPVLNSTKSKRIFAENFLRMQPVFKRLLSSPIFIAIVALTLRILILGVTWHKVAPEDVGRPYGYEMGNVARSIASGRGFSSPFNLVATGPTAWVAPIYPSLVAAIFKIWGVFSIRSLLIIKVVNCVFSSFVVLPLYATARRCFGASVAILASWLWVILPTAWHIPVADIWDSTLAALLLALLFSATVVLCDPPLHKGPFIGYGGLWAIAALTSPALLSLFPFFLVWVAWEAKKKSSLGFQPIAAVLAFVVCLFPWTLRNYGAFGRFVPVRSNFGVELWLGNNPEAMEVNSFRLHPFLNQSEADEYRSLGEVAYVRRKQNEALAFIRAHPTKTLYFIMRRLGTNWFAVSDRTQSVFSTGGFYLKLYFLANSSIILLSWAGAILTWHRQNQYRVLYLLLILIYPLVFYLTHTLVRYRFPMDPILTILAAVPVVSIIESARRRKLNVPTPA